MFELWFSFVGFFEQIVLIFAVMTGSIGFGIILFTIIARLAILPLTLKSIRSSREMQKIQPLIKDLQRKHGKDQKKMQEETIRLYQEHKVNPVGGCLPLLLQLPIFLGVYQAVIHLMLDGQQQYLRPAVQAAVLESNIQPLLDQSIMGGAWRALNIEDPATLQNLIAEPFFGLDLGLGAFSDGFSTFNGLVYVILPVIAIVFMLMQQLMAMPRVQDPQQKMMSQMMMIMPLFFGYIAITFPTGAVLYWATTSTIGVIQQYFISGWGSLANYLKFLPPDRQSRQPPAAQQAPAHSEEVVGSAGGAAVAAAPRRSFWDVMQPLVDADTPASYAGRAPAQSSTHEAPELADEEADNGDDATSQAIEQARQQATPRKPKPKTSSQSRRGRRRR